MSVNGAAADRALGDVGPHLHPVEADLARRIVRALARGGGAVAERSHVEDAAAVCDDLAVALGGAGMDDLGAGRQRRRCR